MEAALEDFAADEGLSSAQEIVEALEQARDETNEFAELDRLIDTMTKKEEFFLMMQKKAGRLLKNKTEDLSMMDDLGSSAGGKSADSGSSSGRHK